MKLIIKSIEKLIKRRFENEGTGHDWYHIDRVRRMSLHIQKNEGGNKDIIELAALLHDISDHKFNGGDFEKGGIESARILTQHGVSLEDSKHVSEIVINTSFKGSRAKDKAISIEAKIVQDADRLDALGAIGIARTFAYGGSINQPIYSPSEANSIDQSKEAYQKPTHTINHFYEKLLLLEKRMHTATAKSIAKERTQLMRNYLDSFYKEWNYK